MKKTLSIILIMTLLSSFMLLTLPTSAAEPTITEAAAKRLFYESLALIQQSSDMTGFYMNGGGETLVYDDRGKPNKYGSEISMPEAVAARYFAVSASDIPGGSFQAYRQKLEEYFTDALINVCLNATGADGNSYPREYRTNDGRLWWFHGPFVSGSYYIKVYDPEELGDFVYFHHSDKTTIEQLHETLKSLSKEDFLKISCDGEKASAKALINGGAGFQDYPYVIDIEYTKTEKGWRISGGDLLELYGSNGRRAMEKLQIWDPFSSPSTGDETPIYIAVCAVSALTVIACGTSVARKRRREN